MEKVDLGSRLLEGLQFQLSGRLEQLEAVLLNHHSAQLLSKCLHFLAADQIFEGEGDVNPVLD